MIDRGMLDYAMERVRPVIQADGGDAVVTDINDEEGIVYVALKGACVDCPLSALTLSQGIERVLIEHVPGVNRVLPDIKETPVFKTAGQVRIVNIDDDDDDDDEEEDEILDRHPLTSVQVTKVSADNSKIENSTIDMK